MGHRDSAGESQGCVGAVGGPLGASNTLVRVGGGPLCVGGGQRTSSVEAGGHCRGRGRVGGGRETAWVAAGTWIGARTPEGAGTGGRAGGWANGPPGEWASGGWANGWVRGSGRLGERGWANGRVRW